MLAPEPHDLAADQHHLDAEDVVGGQPVFEAVHAAGVLGDVAADRAGDLRGRVGRIVETLVLDRLGDGEVGDARLHHGAAVVIVHLEDAVELAHGEQDAVLQRQRAARQRGTAAARHDLDVHGASQRHDLRHLGHRFRQHHHHRHLPVHGDGIALVGPHLARVGEHVAGPHDGLEPGDDGGTLVEDRGLGLRHRQGHGAAPVLSSCRGKHSGRGGPVPHVAVRRPDP